MRFHGKYFSGMLMSLLLEFGPMEQNRLKLFQTNSPKVEGLLRCIKKKKKMILIRFFQAQKRKRVFNNRPIFHVEQVLNRLRLIFT